MTNSLTVDPRAEANVAFDIAIRQGRLSANERDVNYAGHYMFMGKARDGHTDAFKHRMTREYLKAGI